MEADNMQNNSTRREFLKTILLLPGAWLFVSGETLLHPTPAIADDHSQTPSLTAGPYFKPNSPERMSLLGPGITGTKLLLTGVVLFPNGKPAAKALLDFWHADASGEYDNDGFRLRGHQYADENGSYSLETIVPGVYPPRTRHIHVKVQAPNGTALTTQLFFPDEPKNKTDFLFLPALLMTIKEANDGKKGSFNFVLS